jgi:raffinose/stachyose/melibiose transport system substrate-binding protein
MKKVLYLVLVMLMMAVPVSSLVTAQEDVTFTWWHIQTGDPGLSNWQSLADQFMAEHEGVTIEITVLENEAFKARLATVMQAGDPPDLFQSWGGGVLRQFADAGLTRDIAPELEGEWKDSFAAQAALELYGQNGEYYGVPWTWGAVGFFYNKDLFEQAGLDPEAPPATWAEFLTTVQTLKDAGITPITVGVGDKWPAHFYWVYLATRIGGQAAFDAAYSREGSFADEPFVAAGNALLDLIALEPFPEGHLGLGYGDQETVMGNGQAAMDLMGQWSLDVQRGNSESGEGIGDALGWFPFPAVEGGAGDPADVMGGGDGFAVGANAPDAAVEFLKFITTVENQRAMAEMNLVMPVIVGAGDAVTNPALIQVMAARDNAPYFQLYYDQFLPPAVGGVVNDAVETLFAGTGDAVSAAEMIEESAAFELE